MSRCLRWALMDFSRPVAARALELGFTLRALSSLQEVGHRSQGACSHRSAQDDVRNATELIRAAAEVANVRCALTPDQFVKKGTRLLL